MLQALSDHDSQKVCLGFPYQGLSCGALFICLVMHTQCIEFCEDKGPGQAICPVVLVLNQKLEQKKHVPRVETAHHEGGIFILFAAADQIIQLPEDCAAALPFLQKRRGAAHIFRRHFRLEGCVGRPVSAATHGIGKFPGRFSLREEMKVMQEPAPQMLLFKAGFDVASAIGDGVVYDPCQKLSVLIFQIQLSETFLVINTIIQLICDLDHI